MNTSKNAGKLSSLKFLLQVIKDNYEPDHSQKTSGYDPSYNSANKLFKVTKKDIIHREIITLIWKPSLLLNK